MEYDHFSGTGRNKWHTNYLYVVPNPDDIKQDVYRGFNIENPTKIRKSTIEILDRLLVHAHTTLILYVYQMILSHTQHDLSHVFP